MANEIEGLLDAFLYEENEMLDRLDQILVQDESISELSSEDINEIFRIMHTTKSSGAMMGYQCISVVAHKIEDLFSFIREKNQGLDFLSKDIIKELFNLLFKAGDYLRSQISNIESGTPLDENTGELLASIEQMLIKITGESSGDSDVSGMTESASAGQTTERTTAPVQTDPNTKIFIHILLKENLLMENLRAYTIASSVKEGGLICRYYPIDMDTNSDRAPEIIAHGFYMEFDSAAEAEKAMEMLETQHYIARMEKIDDPMMIAMVEESLHNGSLYAMAAEEAAQAEAEYETEHEPVTENANQTAAPAAAANGPVKQNLISVNLQKLDELNNLVGEIVITESMLTSSPALASLPPEVLDIFNKSARQLRKLTNDLQDISMSLRMVPVSGVFQKMNRVVRDMKAKLGKNAVLTIVGEDTEVDKTIVDAIQDPIMHVVRNCMDHGIEATEEERIKAGKNETGEIILKAEHTSSEVIISITDDGYGLDTEKILAKAESKGMLTKPKESYSKKEAMNLIMVPGFSTNQEVTEFSGRGVGMDVVRRNIESIGGSIQIESTLGEGTSIIFKIPLTLAIMNGMKVAVGDTIFTLSISNIRQCFKAAENDLIRDEFGNEMVFRQGQLYPIVRLGDFFHIESRAKSFEDGILIWVESSDSACCIFADDIIGEQQVVVKPLPKYLNSFKLKDMGVNGCTILGDGTISIILDVMGVYQSFIENGGKETY